MEYLIQIQVRRIEAGEGADASRSEHLYTQTVPVEEFSLPAVITAVNNLLPHQRILIGNASDNGAPV